MQLIFPFSAASRICVCREAGQLLKGPDLCIWQKGSNLWEYRLFICPRGREVYDFLGAAS